MASPVHHPRIDDADFDCILEGHGWSLAAELIDGEAVVIPPEGPDAALVQGEFFMALR